MGWYEPEGISDAEDQLQDQIRRGETDDDLEGRLERAKLIEDFDWLIKEGKLPDFSPSKAKEDKQNG